VALQTSVGGYFDTVYIGGGHLEQVAMADAQARIRWMPTASCAGAISSGTSPAAAASNISTGGSSACRRTRGSRLGSTFCASAINSSSNNRRDLQQQADFFSASPTRHSLFASVALRELGGWQPDARGEYRISRYHDPDRQNGIEVTRKDHRTVSPCARAVP